MSERFIRTERLIGTRGLSRLKESCVAVFGIGGVGSYVAEGLARAGVGRLLLIDDDVIQESNINRQIHALTGTVGCRKTEVMKERILSINPEAEVERFDTFVLEDNVAPILAGQIHCCVDAVDTVTAKLAIVKTAGEKGIPVISCMGTGNKIHPELLRLGDLYETSICPLCRVMRRECRKRGITELPVVYSTEEPILPMETGEESPGAHAKRVTPGSMSFVPSAAGMLIAGWTVRRLAGLDPV